MDIEQFAKPLSKGIIQESQIRILKQKLQLMQVICASFYPLQHRCLLSHICACTLEKQIIKQEDLSIFVNYSSLLVDLKDGNFLSTYEIIQKKQNKKDKKVLCYKINLHHFFKVLRPILTELQQKLRKIKEFYQQSQKSQETQDKKFYNRCSKCHTRQNMYMKQFGFDACQNCRGNDFEQVKIDEKERIRMDKLLDIISKVFTKMKQIQDMENKLKNQVTEIKQIQRDIKVKQIDRFLQPYQKLLQEKGQKVELKVDFKLIKEAQRLHAPLTEYQKVKEMIRSRQTRQRTRQKRPITHHDQQNHKVKMF